MLLAVDIGNTHITLGVFDGDKLRATWDIATVIHRTADEYAILLLNLLREHSLDKADIDKVSMCSVVPPMTSVFEDLCHRYLGVSPLVVRAGVKTGVRVRMENPAEVGADRIAAAAAAHHLYGGPVIIADIGTAATFDTVSREGDYLGGAIAPGIGIAAEALFLRTAQLRRVELVRPKHAIGTSTVTAMQSGLVFGYVGLVEGIISRIQQELGEKAQVVATGGSAEFLARETTAINIVNPDLTIFGLKLIYAMNRS
ncbi:MAG: type III pantothenate kinase [Dehalococcoidales bacterium]|nr:type III pantothenate kinase [Dehalococcoidales bacterium]